MQGGTTISLTEASPPLARPTTAHAFMVRRLLDGPPWVIGRAGMLYRDLIPGRLGGSIIASHIRIPDWGRCRTCALPHRRLPVDLLLQRLGAAQSTSIRGRRSQLPHRVLDASENLQVIEIGVPAGHITTVDHEMTLPTTVLDPARGFGGQTFCRSEAAAVWSPWRAPGFEARETGIMAATRGVASVRVARPAGAVIGQPTSHASDILFTFVLSGSVVLDAGSHRVHTVHEGDAFLIPPDLTTAFSTASADLRLLDVALPGVFETTTHDGVARRRASL